VPVTVVFVGLEPGPGATGIDPARLTASQVRSAPLVDRTTRFYEQAGILAGKLEPARLGLTYDYRYRTVFADEAFEDDFFEHLASVALGPVQPTIFQQAYSGTPGAREQIPGDFLIDANEAERWLAEHAGQLGVDTTRPTVFFVNWYGRPDFRFHTYAFFGTRPGWPFPTGFTHAGQMVAFGGSPPDVPYGGVDRVARLWFYDVSAGPDYATANWLLDVDDFDGDSVAEHRIPPVWEYGTSHWYRPFDDLSDDLGKLLRYAAVDLLFGPAPLYDPGVSEPLLADDLEVDLNVFAGRPPRDPLSTFHPAEIPRSLARLDPTRRFSLDLQSYGLGGRLSEVFDCQQTKWTATPRSCFGTGARWDPFYDLDVYFGDHANQYLDATRYEIPLAAFDVPDGRVPPGGIGGFASSRPANVQAWSYVFLADRFREGQGFDDTGAATHEVGHHLGLSHVHDGYDLEQDVTLEAKGAKFFLWTGVETNTGMSYLPNTNEFGQFDRDNMARWQLAARLDNANRILGDVARSPRAARVAAEVAAADARAGAALDALGAWDLAGASRAAADTYHLVLAAAERAGVKVEPWSATADQRNGAGVIAAATDPRDLGPPQPPGRSPGLLVGG